MDTITLRGILFLFSLILLQGLLTGMYYALVNARRNILRDHADEGQKRAQSILRLLENPSSLLSTQQYMSILLSMSITAVLATLLAPPIKGVIEDMGIATTVAEILAYMVLLPPFALFVLLMGYQIPNAVLSGRDETFALIVSRPMAILVSLLTPILRLSQNLSQRIGKIMGGAGKVTIVTEEEIKTLVDAGSEEGVIEDEEKQMIFSVFKFGDTLAREVMVPRIDIVALEVETTLNDALDLIIREGHSRIPVYQESIDHIKGLLYAKDLLVLWRNGDTERALADILREPYFVPESKKAGDLLTELQERKQHLAIVIDEYGGTAGLVTIEDLVEEIVGEIRDEYDFFEEEAYEQVSETVYICIAGLDLDDLNELLDISLPTDENDTLGGYIFSELGKVPEVGDKVETDEVEMEVLTLEGRRIHRVRVRKLEKAPPEDEPETTPTE